MNTWQKLKADPTLWERYFVRERVLKTVRTFFDAQGFHEVETPLLIAHPPAESYVDVFATTLLDRNRTPRPAYLSTSPEVPLKKLMVAGIGNCFALTKSFRNTETDSKTHNPEFTILEWYRTGVPYTAIMEDCEQLVRELALRIRNDDKTLTYRGKRIDIGAPWERITVREAFGRWAEVDLEAFFDMERAKAIATAKGYRVEARNTWEELYDQIYLNEVEPHLGVERPTIIYEFPGSMAALARKKPGDPRYAERFEFYIGGLELGDCYGELTDATEQKRRFDAELAEVKRMGKTAYEYDHDFIDALSAGMPEASGIAVGVDRLVMLMADTDAIGDTLFFPVDEMFAD